MLELALEGNIGGTPPLISEMTDVTKSTVTMRLERLYYKHLIQYQQIGKPRLYYVPLHERFLSVVTQELVRQKTAQGELPTNISAEELEKTILVKYLTDIQVVFGPSQEFFASLLNKRGYANLNLKEELLK